MLESFDGTYGYVDDYNFSYLSPLRFPSPPRGLENLFFFYCSPECPLFNLPLVIETTR